MTPSVLDGVGVGTAGAVGPVIRFRVESGVPADEAVPVGAEQIEAAVALASHSLEAVADDLTTAATRHGGTALGDVLVATAEMARDPVLAERISDQLGAGMGPAAAVQAVFDDYASTFAELGGYMAERVADLHSVSKRVVARICGLPVPDLSVLPGPAIIVARELTPADTAAMDVPNVLGIITVEGGATSHTAIIARQLDIACVVGVHGALEIPEDSTAAIQSHKGTVVVDPPETLITEIKQRNERRSRLLVGDWPGATSDGDRIELLCNIGGPSELATLPKESEGVGLFRTEFLFLDAETAPSVTEQTAIYSQVFDGFAGGKVVLRTLDAGSDKPLAFANRPVEPNPALGVRGYRLGSASPQLLDTQLAAVAQAGRANPATDVWVMAPMISTAQEAADFASRARTHGLSKVGVMIEVPAAALCCGQILEHVDFVSIGTNDLAQYTMAADRLSSALGDLLDPWQPALLELVARVAEAATRAAKPVGVCGESASEPLMALVLKGMGITSLSMSAPAIPVVKMALSRTSAQQCRSLARAALTARSAIEARSAVVAGLDPEARDLILG